MSEQKPILTGAQVVEHQRIQEKIEQDFWKEMRAKCTRIFKPVNNLAVSKLQAGHRQYQPPE